MERLRYFIKEGFKNLKSNGIMTIASIGVLTFCLLLLGSSYLLSLNVNAIIAQTENKNQIMVYLKDNLTQQNIDDIGNKIKDTPNVKGQIFISKQEALDSAKSSWGDQAKLLDGLENDNPLPNSFKVQISDMRNYGDTAKQLGKISGVKSVLANTPIAEKLAKIQWILNLTGICISVILAVVSLFLISNSIKIAVFVRRREINIMKFVGATNGFIRWPFVIEGAIIGIISGLVSVLAEWLVYTRLFSSIFSELNMKLAYYSHAFLYLGLVFTCAGIAVGVVGSMLSLHKHLNV